MTEKITKDEKNYRIHDDKNRAMISKSVEDCGFGRSIVVDASGKIIGGEGIFTEAEKRGAKIRVVESDGTELVVVKRTDISPDDRRRKLLALADNATAQAGGFDFERLKADFDVESLVQDWNVDIGDLLDGLDAAKRALTSKKVTYIKFLRALISCPADRAVEFHDALKALTEKFPGLDIEQGAAEE